MTSIAKSKNIKCDSCKKQNKLYDDSICYDCAYRTCVKCDLIGYYDEEDFDTCNDGDICGKCMEDLDRCEAPDCEEECFDSIAYGALSMGFCECHFKEEYDQLQRMEKKEKVTDIITKCRKKFDKGDSIVDIISLLFDNTEEHDNNKKLYNIQEEITKVVYELLKE